MRAPDLSVRDLINSNSVPGNYFDALIVYRYRGIFRRDPDWSVYNRYRKMYGFTG